MPRALITGIRGQDGSYLADLLIAKGYEVTGIAKPGSKSGLGCTEIEQEVEVFEVDLLDQPAIEKVLHRCKPDEVYNLAARASSRQLWLEPRLTGQVNGLAVGYMLEAIRKINSSIRFMQASSREVFGDPTQVPQTETTPFHPRNPYGVAKAYGHWTTVVYREQKGIFACCAILYNHESPRRGFEFVTRKVSHAVAKIKRGQESRLHLHDLDARRDWGFAGDYVQAMWLMLQQSTPADYVIATGESHSVRELCEIAFSYVGLNYEDHVVQDQEIPRAGESALLVGNAARARRALGWSPSVTFEQLVRMMVDADLQLVQEVPQKCDFAAG